MTHANLVKLSSASVVKEITSANSLIENITGCKVKYFRPPYGSVNTEIRKLVNQLNLTLVMWNIDPRDWDRNNSKEEMLSCYRSSIKDPKDHGYIILQHDMRKDSVELVPDIIELCKNSNFKVVSLDHYLG
jgi:peptidoglycan/xylan/chitin deacetylase (PgdA/CDA1 family)